MKWTDLSDREILGQKDDKARRRINTSNQNAGITAMDIESGVSLETLESLPVPVFKYQTQITIHGFLPDIEQDRVNGYKAIIKNNNGTIGVRYSAIDGKKKKIIAKALDLCPRELCRMSWFENSQGAQLQKSFIGADDLFKARLLKSEIPDLFVGSTYIARDPMTGVIYVVADFCAIPESSLWQFVSWLTSGTIPDQQTYDAAILKYKEEKAAQRKKEQEEYEKEDAERKTYEAELIKPLQCAIDSSGLTHFEGLPYHGLILVRPAITMTRGVAYVYTIYSKHGNRLKVRKIARNSLTTDSSKVLAIAGEIKSHVRNPYSTSGWIIQS